MITIVQKPASLNLSGNLPDFILFSDEQFSFVLKKNGSEVFSGEYTPGKDRKVTINIKNIVESLLSFQFRDLLEVYIQDCLSDNFQAYINNEFVVDFKVVKGGVSTFGMTAETFLQQHFMTWQPREKRVSYSSPEYLTYYAVIDCRVKLKGYFVDASLGTTVVKEMVLAELKQGIVYTIPVMYALILGKLGSSPYMYDVWIEDMNGHIRYSYIQRYIYETSRSEQEEYILFENSLGGIDSFRAYGCTEYTANNTHNIALLDEELTSFRIDVENEYTKNTGNLTDYEAKWLRDFFPSLQKYIFKNNILRRIVLIKDNVSSTDQTPLTSYEFTYRYTDDSSYQNLPLFPSQYFSRELEIEPMKEIMDSNFKLEPRLSEYPTQQLSEGTLFPIQEPFSEEWHITNAGAIVNYLIKKINELTDGRLLDNRFKGYYITETSLKNTYPTPFSGDSAWVGEPFPGVVYTVENGQWKTSGKAPEFGDINLADYYTKEEADSFISEYNVSKIYPTSGIGGSNKYTLETAIALVPEKYRSIGIKCSFIGEDGLGECWEWDGGTWIAGNFSKIGRIRLMELSSGIGMLGRYINGCNTIFVKFKRGFINSAGIFVSELSGTYFASDFVKLEKGKKYYIAASGSASTYAIAAYDTENERSLNTELSVKGTNEYVEKIIVPSSTFYTKITINTSYNPLNRHGVIEIEDSGELSKLHNDIIANNKNISEIEKLNLSKASDFFKNPGFIKNGTGEIQEGGYSHTDFISVEVGSIIITTVKASSSTDAIALYSEDGTYIDSVRGIDTDDLHDYQYIVKNPLIKKARSCTSNVFWEQSKLKRLNQIPSSMIATIANQDDNIPTIAITKSMFKDYTFKKRKAVFSFIFDDGVENDELIKAIFDEYGLRCGFAIYSSNERYKGYYNDGYEILAHAASPVSDPDDGKIKDMLQTAYNKIISMGIECKGWVTPSSALDSKYQPLVYDLYEYGFTIYKGVTTEGVGIPNTQKTYQLWRSSLESLTTEQCKTIIDEAVTNSQLIVFYAHSVNLDTGTNNLTTEHIKEVIEYCKDKGYGILTPYNSVRCYFSHRYNE